MSILDNALQALFKMAHKEIIWENASPASSFADQTIALATLADHDAVMAQFGNSTNIPETTSYQIFLKNKSAYIITYSNLQASAYIYVRSRTVEVTAANIIFGDCYAHATVNQNASVQNGFAIPQVIYGLKF